jgi:hypothetical protein
MKSLLNQHKRRSPLTGPGADQAFTHLASPKIKSRVRLAHLTVRVREWAQTYVGLPVGRIFLRRWLHGARGAGAVERFGLPRHNIGECLEAEALTLHVDPRKLIRSVDFVPSGQEMHPSPLAFIWDGDWDLRRADLRAGSRYRLISELDENRHQLHLTERYRELMTCIEQGEPWASHQHAAFLDEPQRIIEYLNVYVHFLDNMAEHGYDASRPGDELGVAISRDGRILKISRGLHRLAIAQRVGLPSIPVRVRAVHRLWWNQVTDGATGELALKRMVEALRACVPEEEPGPLDEEPLANLPADFWPQPRYAMRPSGDER